MNDRPVKVTDKDRQCPRCKGQGGVYWVGGCSPCFDCMGTGDINHPSATEVVIRLQSDAS